MANWTHEDILALVAATNATRTGPPVPFNPAYSAIAGQSKERIYQPFWDRVNVATAVPASLNFFTQGQGASVTLIRAGATATVQKTLRDTNMITNAVLPVTSLDIRGLSIHMIPLQHAVGAAGTARIQDDKATLYEAGYLSLKPASKTRLELPLIVFAGLDPDFVATTAGTTTTFSRAGVGGFIYPLGEDAMVLPANTPLQIVMNFDGAPTLGQSFDIVLVVHSYAERPVQ